MEPGEQPWYVSSTLIRPPQMKERLRTEQQLRSLGDSEQKPADLQAIPECARQDSNLRPLAPEAASGRAAEGRKPHWNAGLRHGSC